MEMLLKHGVVHGMDGTGNVVKYVFGMEVQILCQIASQIHQMLIHGNNVAKQTITVGTFISMVHFIVSHGCGGEKRDLQRPTKQ